jgi:hypothetical protein
MPTELCEAISEEGTALVEHLVGALQAPETPHYRGAGEAVLRERCQALVAAFADSCRGNPEPFASHVRAITHERLSEGYYLQEIQRALVVLEEAAWQLAVENSNVACLVRNLGLITATIGRAKDELALAYLADARRTRLTLQRLFAGTEGHVEGEAEGPPATATPDASSDETRRREAERRELASVF